MVASHKINFGENSLSSKICCKILNVRTGYLSGTVASFRRLQSPQGRQPPDAFGIMCSGDVQGLDAYN